MGKKLKIQKKNASDSNPKTIDFSSLVEQTNEKLSHQNFPEISLNTVNFTINPSGSDLERKYHKKFIGYLHNEFNAKIIKMYFNYISSTKIIKPIIKDNRPFLIDFLKIIVASSLLTIMLFILEPQIGVQRTKIQEFLLLTFMIVTGGAIYLSTLYLLKDKVVMRLVAKIKSKFNNC